MLKILSPKSAMFEAEIETFDRVGECADGNEIYASLAICPESIECDAAT